MHNNIHLLVSLIGNTWDIGFPSVSEEEISMWMPEASSKYFFVRLCELIFLIVCIDPKRLLKSYVHFDSIAILLHLLVHIWEIGGTQTESISGETVVRWPYAHYSCFYVFMYFNIQKHIYWKNSLRPVFVKFGFPSKMIMEIGNSSVE